eukprot:gb/GFBE01004362.1/.p1 GENE.gb/GFBE01004362.1/~~gb/GFBE01004362.1/.p1  ORF type:complete len:117 (+),score=23.61 gb/GFBE01004362.1/:1-351(+)
MSLLRVATRLSGKGARTAALTSSQAPLACFRPGLPLVQRSFASRSMPRLGHNLEDHYDFAEFMCRMHSPLGEYVIWGLIFSTFIVTFGPLLHSNYYFTGRFLPKDQGNTQLCDDSW